MHGKPYVRLPHQNPVLPRQSVLAELASEALLCELYLPTACIIAIIAVNDIVRLKGKCKDLEIENFTLANTVPQNFHHGLASIGWLLSNCAR